MKSEKGPKAKINTSVKAPAPMAPSLLSDVRDLFFLARREVAQTIMAPLINLYWGIGRIICQDILKENRVH